MKKILIALLLAAPSVSMAQSEWELPDAKKQEAEVKAKKETTVQKAAIDPKYGLGMVPLVDGKVEWSYTIDLKGKSAGDIYLMTKDALEQLTRQPMQQKASRLTAVNNAEHIVAAYFEEEMVFSRKALAKDFCTFHYTIIATASDGKLDLRLCRMSYLYNIGRDTQELIPAKEMISDEEAFNKKQTKMYPIPAKFRKQTIDRKDEIFSFIEEKMK